MALVVFLPLRQSSVDFVFYAAKDQAVQKFYPPNGSQDKARLEDMGNEERKYLEFSLAFAGSIVALRPVHIEALSLLANNYTALGYYADGLKADRALETLQPTNPLVLYNLACSYSLNSMIDDAFAALSRAVKNGYNDAFHMQNDPDLSEVRRDPRFQTLLEDITAATPKP